MLRKKIYTFLAAAIVVAMASVASHATTIYCVCPGATTAPYLYQFDTTCAQMTSCTISGLDGLPCYSGDINSANTNGGFILITTNAGNSDWTGNRANIGNTSDLYTGNLTAINGDYYIFWAYEGTSAYNLTSSTAGTSADIAFSCDATGWANNSNAIFYSTGYAYVYAASVSASSEISKLLICGANTSYSPKLGPSSGTTVTTNTQYALSSGNTQDVPASISAGSYTAYYFSDNVTSGGYLYITEASTTSEDGDDDSNSTATVTSTTYYLGGEKFAETWTDNLQAFSGSDGTYTLEVSDFYGAFKIVAQSTYSDGTTGDYVWYGYDGTGTSGSGYWGFDFDTSYTLDSPGNNNISAGTSGSSTTYDVLFTLTVGDDGSLSLVLTEVESTYDLYVRCSTISEWGATSENLMTYNESDGTYTLTLTDWELQEFKIAVSDWNGDIVLGNGTIASSGREITLSNGTSYSNITFTESGTASTITFTLSCSNDTWTLKVEYTLSDTVVEDDEDDSDDSVKIYIHDRYSSGYYLYVWAYSSTDACVVYCTADGSYTTTDNWPGFDFTQLPTTVVDGVEYYYLDTNRSSIYGAIITDGSSNFLEIKDETNGKTEDIYILIDGSTVSNEQPSYTSLVGTTSDEATDVSSYGYFYIVGDWNELNGLWLPNPYGLFKENTDEDTKDTYSLAVTIYNFNGKFKVLGTESSEQQYHINSGCAWLTSSTAQLTSGMSFTIATNYMNSYLGSNMVIGAEATSYPKVTFYFNPSDGKFMVQEEELTSDEESAYEYKYYLATSFNDYYNGRTSSSSSDDDSDSSTTTSSNVVNLTINLGDNASTFLNGSENAYIYSWYYTEAGVLVEELGSWPGTALELTDNQATLSFERKASANFVISNGKDGGSDGEYQTNDIVLGNYSGDVTITIGSQGDSYNAGYYYTYTTSVTPSSTITFYMVPDETSAPYLYAWDGSTETFGSYPGTQFSSIAEVGGHYLYYMTTGSTPSSALGAIINDGSNSATSTNGDNYNKTVNITGVLADVYLDWDDDGNTNFKNVELWYDNYSTVALINVDQSVESESLSKYTLDESTPYLFQLIKCADLMDSSQDAATYEDEDGNTCYYAVQEEVWYTVIYDITGEDPASVASKSTTDLDGNSGNGVSVISSENTFTESTDFYVVASNAHGDLVKYSTGGSVAYNSYLAYATGNGNSTLSDPGTMYSTTINSTTGKSENVYSYAFFVIETNNVTSSTTSAAARSNVKTATYTNGGTYEIAGGGSSINVLVYLATEEGVETGISKVDADGNVIVEERYFRLDGIEVAEPSTDNRQIYVILRKYDDGSVRAFKEVR